MLNGFAKNLGGKRPRVNRQGVAFATDGDAEDEYEICEEAVNLNTQDKPYSAPHAKDVELRIIRPANTEQRDTKTEQYW